MTNTIFTSPRNDKIMSFEDFLNFEDGTDARYELEDGRLLYMPSESDINQRIASFLFAYLVQLGIPFYCLRIGAEIAVSGTRATVRLPDLMVLSEELAQEMKGASRSFVTLEMLPPRLVVEVVSPGQENEQRDYRYKRSQYQARGIAEYWIIDPIRGQITVLNLVSGLYEEAVFTGDAVIASELLSELGQGSFLTAAQVLQWSS
ncbi:Uma2 family endonuclease [Spirulina sp. CS-785/01]|uniref:Uma2 family endonuclease n=1 Tax=Spirulina sp. CS-785/01 TaxID=3021716 RepID=UPI00232EF99B|nr:Uma2 family endonuclease [Spirulina sp. CS-785/01]MDB9312529.1 Uma2 family endonuclease [Spirulina sp. CS-785/01]